MGERIDLAIDSGCAACAVPVGVASALVMQELNRTPPEYIAANAERIRELRFKTPTLKFQNRDAEFEVQRHGQIAQTSGDGVQSQQAIGSCCNRPSAIQKLLLCACSWPWTFAGPSQSRHENDGGRTDADCLCGLGFFGQPVDRAHNTLAVLIVRDRKSKGIWSHPVRAKGVTHSCPAKTPMTDLDFMGYKRVIFKSDQEPRIVAHSDAVKNV